jgi:hypothetical protein
MIFHEFFEGDFRLPAKLLFRLVGITELHVRFGRPQIARVEIDVVVPVEPHGLNARSRKSFMLQVSPVAMT